MKVVVFTHAAGSPEHGPNLRWYYLGRRLKELGCEVTIVGSSFFHKYASPLRVSGFSETKNIDGIEYVFLKNVSYNGIVGRLVNQLMFPIMSLLWVSLRGANRRPDIVVASSPPPFCIFAASKLVRKTGASLVYEVRDLWPMVVQQLSGASSSHPYIKILKYTERFAVRNADLVVSVKPGDFDYFSSDYGLSRDKFSWQPNGFLPSDDDGREVCESAPFRQQAVTVGYVGAMSTYYGLRELIQAADLLKDDPSVKFVLVGGGEDFSSLLSLKESLGLENVEFVGKIPKDEVPQHLKKFDICYVGLKDVPANLHGISCNKIFEYMYAGKPIIASYRTLFDPVEQANCGITVAPGSPLRIKEAILALRDSVDKREIMGAAARKYFDANHDFSVIGEKYLEKMRDIRKHG